MKLSKLIYLVIVFSLCNKLCAWENKKTHPALTDNGIAASTVDVYLKTQLGLRDGASAELKWDFPSHIKERLDKGTAEPDKTTRTILEWVKAGSVIEDEDGRRWPLRSRHHFHDPNRNAGLDNKTDHPEWWGMPTMWPSPFDLTGGLALNWATQGNAPMEPTINNHPIDKEISEN